MSNYSCPTIDFVFLQDLSGPYTDDLPVLQSQIANVIGTVQSIDQSAHFAVASFIDKPDGTFGASDDYVYETELVLTSDSAAVIDSVNSLSTQSGADVEEAQLEALLQVALREDEIGYRPDSQRIVMLSTDSAYHEAGDFAAAGPNNGDAVLDGGGLGEDYPEIAQVAAALAASGVFPVFSVTAAEAPTYQALVDELGTGAVVILSSDSSDFADAVRTAIALSCGHVTEQGTELDDILEGTEFEDGLFGLGGDDDLRGRDGTDLVDGGSGNDTVHGEQGSDDVYGGTGDDKVYGGGGKDFLFGGLGDDTLKGGGGKDTFVFNPDDGNDVINKFKDGTDIIDLSTFHQWEGKYAVTTAVQDGKHVVMTLPDGTTITLKKFSLADLSLDDVILNPVDDAPTAVDDAVTVTEGQTMVLDVLANDSDIDGDAITIVSVTDPLNGTVSVNASGEVVYTAAGSVLGPDSFTYTISDGDQTDTATVTVSVLPNLNGDDSDNWITATDAPELIDGAGGNDTISALGGDDTVTGGTGRDSIDGGAGNDFIDAGSGSDVIVGGPATGNDLFDSDTISGGNGYDTISGGWDSDLLNGDKGNDSVMGDAGDDAIFGGDGNDTLDGGTEDDDIDGGADDDLIFGGSGNDQIEGGSGNDTVDGGSGDDEFIGSGDTKAGLSDDDRFTGGSGADVFIYEFSVERNLTGDDVITDYDVAQDLMEFDGEVEVTLTDTADGVLIQQLSGGSILVLDVLVDDIRGTISGLFEIDL